MIEDQYRELRDRLNYDTGHHSMMGPVKRHPAYRQIVDLGKSVVPLILADFDRYRQTGDHEDFPGHWTLSILRALTDDELPGDVRPGVIDDWIEGWIRWGEANGILSKNRPKYAKPPPPVYDGWIVVGLKRGEESVLCPKREPRNAFEAEKGTAAWVSKIDAARGIDDGWWKKHAWILATKDEAEIVLEVLNEKIKNGECSEFNRPDRTWVEEI